MKLDKKKIGFACELWTWIPFICSVGLSFIYIKYILCTQSAFGSIAKYQWMEQEA